MAYKQQYWNDYDETKTETQNIENGAVVTSERMNNLENGIVGNYNELELNKADKEYVNAQLNNIVSGTPKESFNILADLEKKYPKGAPGIYLVISNGHFYYWVEKTKKWTDGGLYQAPLMYQSILPQRQKYWHTFKVDTLKGNYFMYNGIPSTVENTVDFYTTSQESYGCYSFRIKVNGSSSMYLKGSQKYLVSVVEYNNDLLNLNATEWINETGYSYRLQGTTKLIIIAVKRRDNKKMSLSEIDLALSEVLVQTDSDLFLLENEVEISDYKIEETEWEQGSYRLVQGQVSEPLSYSNYRVSKTYVVNPSTDYLVDLKLSHNEKTFRYAIYLLDEQNKLLNNSGWIITKTSIKLRTTPDTKKIIVMAANTSDSIMIKTKELGEFGVNLGYTSKPFTEKDIDLAVSETKKQLNPFHDIDANSWIMQNIAIRPGQKTGFGSSETRAHIYLDIDANKNFLIDMQAPFEYRFTFGHAYQDDIGIYDSYWHWGSYRYLTREKPERLYIVVSRKDDLPLNVTDLERIKPTIKEVRNAEIDFVDSSVYGNLIMHRGANMIAPEDTVPALKEAARAKAWASEMDVQYTKDNVAIIMHDETVDRMTNGTGRVSDMTLSEIKALTITSGNNIHLYPNLKIPTLEEMIFACRRYGIIPVLDCGAPLASDEQTILLVNDLEKLGLVDSCIVLTQGTVNACNFRYFNKRTPIIVQYAGNLETNLEIARLYRYQNAYFGGWNFDRTGATDLSLRNLWQEGHKRNMKFYAITNKHDEAEKWLLSGCDFISSDDLEILDY